MHLVKSIDLINIHCSIFFCRVPWKWNNHSRPPLLCFPPPHYNIAMLQLLCFCCLFQCDLHNYRLYFLWKFCSRPEDYNHAHSCIPLTQSILHVGVFVIFFIFILPAQKSGASPKKFRNNAKAEQASFWSKFKAILMVFVMIWHQLDNIESKRI